MVRTTVQRERQIVIELPVELLVLCAHSGYVSPRVLPDGRWAAVMPLIYTGAIITMKASHAHLCYEDRWCYHSIADATKALKAWDGEGEPAGWHRHPASGRRREDGDPLKEYVNP